MYLFIATPTNAESVIFLADTASVAVSLRRSIKRGERRNPLKDIDAVLAKRRVTPKALAGIAVIKGPGQFSSLRTGLSIANAFGCVLGIPVAGIYLEKYFDEEFFRRGIAALARKKKFAPVYPDYGAEPNITKNHH